MRLCLLLSCFFLPAALVGTIVLPSAPPEQVAMDWDGIDDYDGDGTLAFATLGDTQTAVLRVLCNSTQGYTIWFNTPNATGKKSSKVVTGGGGEIAYTAVLDTSGILRGNVRKSSLNLQNSNSSSVRVKFNQPGNVLPLDGATQANEIALDLTLDQWSGSLVPMGVYTDVITATIALN